MQVKNINANGLEIKIRNEKSTQNKMIHTKYWSKPNENNNTKQTMRNMVVSGETIIEA